MRWDGLVAACAVGLLISTVGATEGDSLPKPWFRAGTVVPRDRCRASTSEVAGQAFDRSLVIRCAGTTDGFVTVMQQFNPTDYRGKRVRLSAKVRGESIADWAGLWMRVDGDVGKQLAFDNMQGRALRGTFDWEVATVVLNVAPDAAMLAFGVLQSGDGVLSVGAVSIEVVGFDVAVTSASPQPLPDSPGNLSFKP